MKRRVLLGGRTYSIAMRQEQGVHYWRGAKRPEERDRSQFCQLNPKKKKNYSLLVLSLVWTPATFCISSPMPPEEFTTIHVFDHMQSLAQHRMGQRLAVCCHLSIVKCGDVRPKALFHCRILFTTADRMSHLEHYIVSKVHGI